MHHDARLAETRQPSWGRVHGRALWRRYARRRILSEPGDDERPLSNARWEEHGPKNRGRPRAKPKGQVDSRLVFQRRS